MLPTFQYSQQIQKASTHIYANRASTPINAMVGAGFISRAIDYTTWRNGVTDAFVKEFNIKVMNSNQNVQKLLITNPAYEGARQQGVKLAREAEQYDLFVGGKGIDQKWTMEQWEQIKNNYNPSGYEGHHINNVHNNRELQSNPDNIKFVTKEQHLQEHHGNFHNETKGKLKDIEKSMKRDAFRNKILPNEMKAVGMTALCSFVIGTSMHFVISIAMEGLDKNNIHNTSIESIKTGGITAACTTGGYLITRVLSKKLKIGSRAIKLTEGSVVSILMISIDTIKQYKNYLKIGYDKKETIEKLVPEEGMNMILALAPIGAANINPVLGVVATCAVAAFTFGQLFYNKYQTKKLHEIEMRSYYHKTCKLLNRIPNW